MTAIITQAAPTSAPPQTQNYTKSGITASGALAFGSIVTATMPGTSTSYGLSIGATDFTDEGCIWVTDEDNQTTTDTAHRHDSTHTVSMCAAGSNTVTESAVENNAVTDGAQLSWDNTSAAKYVSMLLLDDGVDSLDYQNYDLGTGADTVTTGFQADIVIVFSTFVPDDTGQDNATVTYGFYERSGDSYVAMGMRCNHGRDLSVVDTQTADGVYTTDMPCAINEVGSFADRFTFGSFTATGYDVTRTQGTGTRRIGLLSIKLAAGYNAKVGTAAAPTSTGDYDLITGLTGVPKWCLLMGTTNTSVTGGVGASLGVGMVTAAEEATVMSWSEDAVTANSNSGQQHSNASSLFVSNDAGSIISRADFSSFSSGKATFNFVVASTAVLIGYLAISAEQTNKGVLLRQALYT